MKSFGIFGIHSAIEETFYKTNHCCLLLQIGSVREVYSRLVSPVVTVKEALKRRMDTAPVLVLVTDDPYLLLGRNMDSLMKTEPDKRMYQQLPMSSGLQERKTGRENDHMCLYWSTSGDFI